MSQSAPQNEPTAEQPTAKRKGGQIGHKGGNQYTARREQKDALDNAERWQDNPRYRAGALMRMLRDNADGTKPLNPSQIKSIEIMLDRTAARLSAVEQTVIEPAARLTEQEIRAQLAELVANHGGLLQELIAEHARASVQTVSEAPEAPAIAQSGDTDHTQPIDNTAQAVG